MENKILYIGDCPNQGDLGEAIEIQKDYLKWKSKQPIENTKYYYGGMLN